MADLLYDNLVRQRQPRRFRRYNDTTNNFLNDHEIKSKFRFNKETIEYLITLLSPDLLPNTRRNRSLSVETQVLVALRFFASGSFLEVIGDTFGFPKSTVSRCISAVAKALVRKKDNFIQWPDHDQQTTIRQHFYAKTGFPGVIGLIDCTLYCKS